MPATLTKPLSCDDFLRMLGHDQDVRRGVQKSIGGAILMTFHKLNPIKVDVDWLSSAR
jgi:hypothetical protein